MQDSRYYIENAESAKTLLLTDKVRKAYEKSGRQQKLKEGEKLEKLKQNPIVKKARPEQNPACMYSGSHVRSFQGSTRK